MRACRGCTLRPMRTSPRRAAVKSDDGAQAGQIGGRLKPARHRAGLTQQQLAGTRYTKAYVSALENGLVRPSMVALTFFASQLDLPPARLITDEAPAWSRLEAARPALVRAAGLDDDRPEGTGQQLHSAESNLIER